MTRRTQSRPYLPAICSYLACISQAMQETIQYDACDENNWSNQGVVNTVGGTAYTAASACGQLGQSYQARDRAEIARRDRAPRSRAEIARRVRA